MGFWSYDWWYKRWTQYTSTGKIAEPIEAMTWCIEPKKRKRLYPGCAGYRKGQQQNTRWNRPMIISSPSFGFSYDERSRILKQMDGRL